MCPLNICPRTFILVKGLLRGVASCQAIALFTRNFIKANEDCFHNINLSFQSSFPCREGAIYRVRLHFIEFLANYTDARYYSVFIDGVLIADNVEPMRNGFKTVNTVDFVSQPAVSDNLEVRALYGTMKRSNIDFRFDIGSLGHRFVELRFV